MCPEIDLASMQQMLTFEQRLEYNQKVYRFFRKCMKENKEMACPRKHRRKHRHLEPGRVKLCRPVEPVKWFEENVLGTWEVLDRIVS